MAAIRMLNTIQWVEGSSIKSRLVAIAGSSLYEEEPVGQMALASVPGTFNSAKNIQSAARNQILYIADHSDDTGASAGTNQPKKFDPATSAVANWTASTAGTIPKGCPYIANWRDRLILAGGTTNPHLVSASRQGDPLDWDYAEDDTGAAWTESIGLLGDVVTALIPHNQDCLIIGCASSMWIYRGDPGFQGSKDNLSHVFGIVDGNAWCHTPDNWVVFLSQDGLKAIPAGCGGEGSIQDLSRVKLPEELLAVDRTTTSVAMGFDVRDRGVHVFLTPYSAGSTSATHWFLDWETKAFWKVVLGSADYEPYVLHSRVNYVPSSQAHSSLVLGCRDGYIRRFQNNVTTDDGTAFNSYLLMGPFGDSAGILDLSIDEICAVLARKSGNVKWEILAGDTPEEALRATARESGLWVAGRNNPSHPRVRAPAMYVKLSNADSLGWAWESGSARVGRRGRTRV